MSLGHYVCLFFIVLGCEKLPSVEGHGRLIEPASRNCMWRFNYKNPRNYNDMGLNCGGFTNQFERQGGRCGVCGDAWEGPRDHEAGGKYARGVVARQYQPGAFINVTVELTSNHQGYFEFRLCPVNDPTIRATQACLDRYLLNIVGHGTRYFIERQGASIYVELAVMLPPNLQCSQCVLQWKWVAGQSMGPDGFGGECLGCGNQENFINCADIAIGNSVVSPLPALPETAEPAPPPASHAGPSYDTYNSGGVTSMDPNMVLVNQIVSKLAETLKSKQYAATQPPNSWNANSNLAHHEHRGPTLSVQHHTPIPVPRWTPAPAPVPQQTWQAPPQPQQTSWQSSQHHSSGYEWTNSGSTYPHFTGSGYEHGEYPEPGEVPSSGSSQSGYMQGYNDALRQLKEQFGMSRSYGGNKMANSPYNEISVHLQDHQKHGGPMPSSCPDGSELECRATTSIMGSDFDSFCSNACNAGECPSNLCSCTCPGGASTWSGGSSGPGYCRSVDPSKAASMDQWCSTNCKNNHCPSDLCVC